MPIQTVKKIAKPPKPPRKTTAKKPVVKPKDTLPKIENAAKRMPKKTEKQPKKNQPKQVKSIGIAKTQPSATALNEIEAAAAQPKYYTNFDFFYKRTSFRTMALFFKTAFAPYLEKWKLVKK